MSAGRVRRLRPFNVEPCDNEVGGSDGKRPHETPRSIISSPEPLSKRHRRHGDLARGRASQGTCSTTTLPLAALNACSLSALGSDAAYMEVCPGAFVDFCAGSPVRQEECIESMEKVSCAVQQVENNGVGPHSSQLDEHILIKPEPSSAELDPIVSYPSCVQTHVHESLVDTGTSGAEAGTNEDEAIPFMVEASTTNRARCRACKQLIRVGAPRCGARVWFKVRWEVRWCHASCFLRGLGALYSKSGRRRCRVTGKAFAAGDIEVRIGFGDPYTYSSWLPDAARKFTHEAAMMIGRSAVREATRVWREAAVEASNQDGVLGGFGGLLTVDRDMLCKLLIPDELPETRSFHVALASLEAPRLDLSDNDTRLNLSDSDVEPTFLDLELTDDNARPAFLDLTEC